MKLRRAVLWVAFTASGFILMGIVALLICLPSNDRDNADPKKKQEMVSISLDWGRLAPFPATAKDFCIYTEGNAFTRTFRGSFSDSPESIKRWIEMSPGIKEGEMQETKIILKTGGGAAYGEVLISADGSRVTFRVSWS